MADLSRDKAAYALLEAAEAVLKTSDIQSAALLVARAAWVTSKKPLEGVSDEALLNYAFHPLVLSHWGLDLGPAVIRKRMAQVSARLAFRKNAPLSEGD